MGRNLSEGSARAVKELLDIIPQLRPDERIDFLEMLVCGGVHIMRAGSGEDYVRGFLTSAIADLDKPPTLVIRDLDVN